MDDGSVWCWGRNNQGQIGQPADALDHPVPVRVTALSNIVEVFGGASGFCALRADGRAFCWGDVGSGILGDGVFGGTPVISHVPVAIAGPANIRTLSFVGVEHHCMARASGQVLCGDSSGHYVPVALTGPFDSGPSIAAGSGVSCSLSNGEGRCWGTNSYGQLGTGDTVDRRSPSPVAPFYTSASMVTTRWLHACALLVDGTAQCWGDNAWGQLGTGDRISQSIPTDVAGLLGERGKDVSAGGFHTCALLADGGGACWGDNAYGQLGNGTTLAATEPVNVSGLANAVQIASGFTHTCALVGDGTVQCWGNNDYGQLGTGSRVRRSVPTPTAPLFTTAVAITAGGFHTCALLSDGTAQCWGDNSWGQLGTGDFVNYLVPTDVFAVLSYQGAAISAGNIHTCALTAHGEVSCWGDNTGGQLGDGTYADRNYPGFALDLGEVERIAAGDAHTCARRTDGTMWCWGDNAAGPLGVPSISGSPVPVQVSGLP
jgi:alpha-tubulin suppressor-like RCC1 family protein